MVNGETMARRAGRTGRQILGVFAALAAAAVWGADPDRARPGPRGARDAIRVESAIVSLAEQVQVPAQEAGVIAAVCVREGEMVERGELLAQIDDTEAQLQEKRARIELENARAQAENRIQVRFAKKAHEVAQAELRRATDSLQRYPKSISDTEIDRLRLAAEKAALAVEQSEFDLATAQYSCQLRQAELQLATHHVQRRKITAPLAGMLVEVKRRQGEWVEPSETVFRILRLDQLRAEGYLHADEIREELVGRAVLFRTNLPGEREADFSGRLVFVSPEISPVNGQVRVWAEIENLALLLRPGLRGVMLIQPAAAKPVADDMAGKREKP